MHRNRQNITSIYTKWKNVYIYHSFSLEQVEPFLPTSQSLHRWSLETAPLLQLSFSDYGILKEARFRKVTISTQLPNRRHMWNPISKFHNFEI